MNTQEAIERTIKLRLKPVYDREDIMELEGCAKSTATHLMVKLRNQYGGAILGRPNSVRADAYYAYCGWNYKDYISNFLGGLNATNS